MEKHDNFNLFGRREFLTNATILAGASMLTTLPGIGLANSLNSANATYTVKQVFDIMISENTNAPLARTNDQLRSGSMDQEVVGIVTTMFPTIEVINKTIKAGANMIIAHETPFFNNEDQTDWLKDDDVYNYKMDLLNKNKIAIVRFHDYWHSHKPDGIAWGNLLKLGWEKYYTATTPRMITLPQPMPLQSIVTLVKKRLEIPQVRLVGDLKMHVSTVYLAFGYMDSKAQIAAIEKMKPDLILSGETREWETVERVRDGLAMGDKTSLMVLSHSVSEEAGMEYAANWLQPKMPGMKITHIASGTPFQYL
jgi:putative NIF3 family GTP cyclohydrolase 1 type 2